MELHEFKEYIKHVNPTKKVKCDAWKVAIGLQAVDGLTPSSFLLDTARREIEGEITIAEAELLIKSYYESKKKMRTHLLQVEGSTPQATPQVDDITPQVEGETPQATPQVGDITPQVEGGTPQVTPQATPQVEDITPQVHGIYLPNNEKVVELIKVVGREQQSTKDMMSGLGLKDRKNFVQLYLIPALDSKYLRYLYPDKPKHPRQKYLLTVKGLMLFDELVK